MDLTIGRDNPRDISSQLSIPRLTAYGQYTLHTQRGAQEREGLAPHTQVDVHQILSPLPCEKSSSLPDVSETLPPASVITT